MASLAHHLGVTQKVSYTQYVVVHIEGHHCVSCCSQETLAWLANPANTDPDALPPGLEGFDPVPYLSAAVPITLATFGTQMVHELGHRVLASLRKVPSLQSQRRPSGTQLLAMLEQSSRGGS